MSLLKLGPLLLDPLVKFNVDLGPHSDDNLLPEDSARQAQKSNIVRFRGRAVDSGRLCLAGHDAGLRISFPDPPKTSVRALGNQMCSREWWKEEKYLQYEGKKAL